MYNQYMPDTSSSNWSGTNAGYGPPLPVPAPVQARPQPLNHAAGKGMYIMLVICTVILFVRSYLFDIGLLLGRTTPPSEDETREASDRYQRYLWWCAFPELIVLSFGSSIAFWLNWYKQSKVLVLWSIFCILLLEPLGYDIYNAWESYGDPRFEPFIWFYLLVVLYRVVILVASVIFLVHLMHIVNKNQRIVSEGGVEGGVPPVPFQDQIESEYY